MKKFIFGQRGQNPAAPKLTASLQRASAQTTKSVKPTLATLQALRPSELTPDLQTLELCQDAKAYLSWIEKTFPDRLTSPSSQSLDKVMLAVTKEYIYRRKYTKVHAHKTCLIDVFHGQIEQLLEKQLELTRHKFLEPPKGTRATLVPALYIGTGETEDVPAD